MNKISYLTYSGLLIALAGICMYNSESVGVHIAKVLVPILFLSGGILTYLFSTANKQHKLANQYHGIQGVGVILFALLIGFGANDLGDFLKYVTYFMLFFGFIEILFGFMALNSSQKLNIGILIYRFISGFFTLIGGVLILVTSITNEISGLSIAGVLVALSGLAIIIFSYKVKNISRI